MSYPLIDQGLTRDEAIAELDERFDELDERDLSMVFTALMNVVLRRDMVRVGASKGDDVWELKVESEFIQWERSDNPGVPNM